MDRPPAAYLRLSVTREDSVSIDGQRQLALGEVERRGWPQPTFYVDEGVSGSRDVRRPGRDALEEAIAQGRHGALIVKSVDRLARSTSDFARIVKLCERTGTALVVTDLNVDTTSAGGQMVLNMLAALAQFEAGTIGARVRASNRERVRQGRALGGRVPYHLENVKTASGTTRRLHPQRSRIVQEMVERITAGESYRSVAADLTRRGVQPPQRGGEWRATTVRTMLTSPTLAGLTVHEGQVVTDPATGLPRVDPDTALLTLEEWDALREAMSQRGQGHKPRRRREDRLLVEGLARCAACGGLLQREVNGAGTETYRCPRHTHGTCPAAASIVAHTLDLLVTDDFLTALGEHEETVMTRTTPPEVQRDLDLAAQQVETLLERMATATPEEIPEVAASLATVRATQARLGAQRQVVRLRGTGRTIRQAWEAADHQGRRALLGRFVQAVEVAQGRGPERVRVLYGAEGEEG